LSLISKFLRKLISFALGTFLNGNVVPFLPFGVAPFLFCCKLLFHTAGEEPPDAGEGAVDL